MVDFTAAITKGVGLASMLGTQEQFIKKATEQIEKARGEIGDKIDIRQSKLSELSSLQNLITSVKSQAKALTNVVSNSFENKKVTLSTADAGAVDEYLTGVQVDGNAMLGSVKVEVQAVATQSKFILASALNTGFQKGVALGKTGNMILTVAGTPRAVAIAPGDTIEQIRDKTNQQFQANGDQFEAFLVDVGGGRAYLEIRAKQTGVAQTIAVAYNNGAVLPQDLVNLDGGNLHTQSYVAGVDASVVVEGLPVITQASNKFTNVVPGLSFTLAGRINVIGVSSTITTAQDTTAAKDSIIKFGNALNDMAYLIAKNNPIKEVFTVSDPTVLQNFDSEDSPLKGSFALREALQVWQTFTTARNAAAGEFDSIYALGMGVKPAVKDGVTYQTVYFEDEGKFNKALNDTPDKVRRFFVTDTAITPTGGALSSLKWVPGEFDRSVSGVVANRDITITATYHGGNAGELVGVSTTISGVVYDAVITPVPGLAGIYNAKFADSSPLNGMEFRTEARGVALGAVNNFTVNIKPGMANIVTEQLRDMLHDSGKMGTTVLQGELFNSEIDTLNTELARVEKELKALTTKMNQEYQAIAQLDLMAGIQTAMVQAVLASLTAPAA